MIAMPNSHLVLHKEAKNNTLQNKISIKHFINPVAHFKTQLPTISTYSGIFIHQMMKQNCLYEHTCVYIMSIHSAPQPTA